jgi:predicted nuclease of restriction endonuclease-like (RecB) superfamily
MTGLSRANLHHMRRFADAWPEQNADAIVQQPVRQLPWGQNIALLTKLKDRDTRLWYAAKAIQHGWSRKALEAQIATDLRGRQGNALTSFEHSLPVPESELARDAIKDPYNFEFLGLSERAKERDLELALLNDIQSFLMEMGHGFALVGRQFPLKILDEETGEYQEFFVDLLFYNYILRRFVVIDLKIEDFKPEFAGKMSFYLTAVDELERQPGDEPSIGLVLCPCRSKTVTEWALQSIDTRTRDRSSTEHGARMARTPQRPKRSTRGTPRRALIARRAPRASDPPHLHPRLAEQAHTRTRRRQADRAHRRRRLPSSRAAHLRPRGPRRKLT